MQQGGSRTYGFQSGGSAHGQYSQSGPIAAFMVTGKTGAGKSSFIKLLGGRDLAGDEPVADGGLDSCTKSPTIYLTTINNRKVLLLDTPGFDDSAGIENLEVLNEIAANLHTFALQNQDIETRGVIFLHDISEVRFAGSQRKTLEILKAICGTKGMRNCVIGTTMWNTPGTGRFRNEETREQDFLRSHWKGILKTTRIPEGSQDAAMGIINDILARPPVLLQLQEEMLIPPHTLENTTAGKIAIPEGRAEAERIRKEAEEQQREFERERERKQAEYEREREESRRKYEEERAKQEQEHQRQRQEQQEREDEQRRQFQEDMRKLDEEHRERARKAEEERRAEQKRKDDEEKKRWTEFVREQQEAALKAEAERQKQFDLDRKQREKEAKEAREAEEERFRKFKEELAKSKVQPERVPWWEKALGLVAEVATSFLGSKLGKLF